VVLAAVATAARVVNTAAAAVVTVAAAAVAVVVAVVTVIDFLNQFQRAAFRMNVARFVLPRRFLIRFGRGASVDFC